MPESGPVCSKCRVARSTDSDSWCDFCSGAASLSEAAKTRFHSPAHRRLAEELVVQATRQVRALVTLDRQVQSQTSSLSDRLKNAQVALENSQTQVEKTAVAKKKPVPEKSERKEPARSSVKEEKPEDRPPAEEADYERDESEESYEEESEEEEKSEGKSAEAASGSVREAPRSPRTPDRRSEVRKRKRGEEPEARRETHRRGGRKHQARFRGLQEPTKVFHRNNNLAPLDLGGRPRQTFYSRRWQWEVV